MTRPLRLFSYSIDVWEDGQLVHKENLVALDRWEIQAAHRLALSFDSSSEEVVLHQDPHSNELGGYLWQTSVMFCFYLRALLRGEIFETWIASTEDPRKLECMLIPSSKPRLRRKHESERVRPFKTFLELGAGVTGLPSLVLHRQACHGITTDLKTLMPALNKNVNQNRVHTGLFQALPLEWSHKDDAILKQYIETEVLRSFDIYDGLDALILADCIYSEASASALVDTMRVLSTVCFESFQHIPEVYCISEIRNSDAQISFQRYAEPYFHISTIPNSLWQVGSILPESLQFTEVNLYRLRLKMIE